MASQGRPPATTDHSTDELGYGAAIFGTLTHSPL